MTGARYLLRFDDLHDRMDHRRWNMVEQVLIDAEVSPLLAVIPDNADQSLNVDDTDPDFWARVRNWQARGWAIGLHGWRHQYESSGSGLLGRRPLSEFAGLGRERQTQKLEAAVGVFRGRGVRPDAFVAPGHSFDATTLEVMVALGLNVISDGFGVWPHRDERGVLWVPQQLWWPRWRAVGVWTICLHHSSWDDARFDRFRRVVRRFPDRFMSLPAIERRFGSRQPRWYDGPATLAVRATIGGRDLLAGLRG